MNHLLIEPADVFFFRDGRPMNGSLAGHGAQWPTPVSFNAAVHAALHERLPTAKGHPHADAKGARNRGTFKRFGALQSVGPFPVCRGADAASAWYLPAPADLVRDEAGAVHQNSQPAKLATRQLSSLPHPLEWGVASLRAPSKKDVAPHWLRADAWSAYLRGHELGGLAGHPTRQHGDVFSQESTVGIGIDPATQAQDGESIYSAHYLRLKQDWKLGALATCPSSQGDLVAQAFRAGRDFIFGGQQRRALVCDQGVAGSLPLPLGLRDFAQVDGVCRVKWVLLTPAVWPAVAAGPARRHEGRSRLSHHGGWLPNWINHGNGELLLRALNPGERERRRGLNAVGRGYLGDANSTPVPGRLVAALVPKPVALSGWSLGTEDGLIAPGAKATHLAVPAGAIYYFETKTPDEARLLADALNWHGDTHGPQIKNRRSTLAGEKGLGLGVCGTWKLTTD